MNWKERFGGILLFLLFFWFVATGGIWVVIGFVMATLIFTYIAAIEERKHNDTERSD